MFARMTLALAASTAFSQTFQVDVVPTAMTKQTDWKYTTSEPPPAWSTQAYDDAAWGSGPGGFGATGTPGSVIGTVWSDSSIWMPKTFLITNPAAKAGLALLINHDENVEVYVNGVQVFSESDYTVRYMQHELWADAQAAFKDGENLLAVHCKQTLGGQYIDVGIVESITGAGTPLVGDARGQAATWKYTTVDPASTSWIDPDFADAGWSTGKGGFGNNPALAAATGTPWETDDIWMRQTFALPAKGFNWFGLSINHDDDAQVYLNGMRVALLSGNHTHPYGMGTEYQDLDITEAAKTALRPGNNVLAIHCRNLPPNFGQTGPTTQYLDASLSAAILGAAASLPPIHPVAGNATPKGPRFYAWRPGQGRLLVGIPGQSYRRFDLIGKSARAVPRWAQP